MDTRSGAGLDGHAKSLFPYYFLYSHLDLVANEVTVMLEAHGNIVRGSAFGVVFNQYWETSPDKAFVELGLLFTAEIS